MRPCIIVNFFTSSLEQEYVLSKSLESLSKLDYDIILSCNNPISKEIQSLCTHVIYNKKNRLMSFVDGLKNDFELVPTNFFKSENKTLEFSYINFLGRSYIVGILDSLYSSYNFAKSLGYTHAHFFVGDIILKPNQQDKLTDIEESYKEWYGYFENRVNKVAYKGVECLYWYSEIDWFIKLFLSEINNDNFITSLKDCYYLESYFAKIIYKNDNIYVKNFKSNSKISFLDTEDDSNLSTTNVRNAFTLLWDNKSNKIDFFLLNYSENIKLYELFVSDEHRNTQYFKYKMLPGYFYLNSTNRDFDENLNIKLIEDGKVLMDFSFDSHCIKRFKEIYEIHSNYKLL
jgi:hypothetical protein